MIGLGDTLQLLKAGYKKKDIDALIAQDEEEKKKADSDSSKVGEVPPAPVSEGKQEDTPDYKKMYEELLEKNKKTEEELTSLQSKNIQTDMSGDAQKAKEEERSSLLDSIKGFM